MASTRLGSGGHLHVRPPRDAARGLEGACSERIIPPTPRKTDAGLTGLRRAKPIRHPRGVRADSPQAAGSHCIQLAPIDLAADIKQAQQGVEEVVVAVVEGVRVFTQAGKIEAGVPREVR
jgi:hypothetical protein